MSMLFKGKGEFENYKKINQIHFKRASKLQQQ